MGIQTCKQTGSGRAGASTIVELSETKSLSSKRINIGRRNLATITPDIRIAHIVSHNKDDIRTLISIFCSPARND